MVRLVGAALVAAGGGWLGFQAAAGLRSRVRTLEEVQAGLALMEGELELNAPPIMTPTAISITLPRAINCLNSSMNFFIRTAYPF